MKTLTKILLIFGIVLVAGGAAISILAFSGVGFDYSKLGYGNAMTEKVSTFSADGVKDIRISDISSKVVVVCGDFDNISVVSNENDKCRYIISAGSGILDIKKEIHLDFNPNHQKSVLKVSLPEKVYRTCDISTVSGDINIENLKVEDSFNSAASSGKIELNNVSSGKDFTAATVSGDIEFENIEAESFSFQATSGDIEGKLEDKGYRFDVSSVSGDVEIPDSTGDRLFKAVTVSGDIKIKFL